MSFSLRIVASQLLKRYIPTMTAIQSCRRSTGRVCTIIASCRECCQVNVYCGREYEQRTHHRRLEITIMPQLAFTAQGAGVVRKQIAPEIAELLWSCMDRVLYSSRAWSHDQRHGIPVGHPNIDHRCNPLVQLSKLHDRCLGCDIQALKIAGDKPCRRLAA